MKKALFLLITLCLFTACGRGLEGEADTYAVYRVFTISTPTGIPLAMVNQAATNLQARLASDGVYVSFEIEHYRPRERERHLERKLGMFAAGIGPDIFVRDGFLLSTFTENGFIRDIHPLIKLPKTWS